MAKVKKNNQKKKKGISPLSKVKTKKKVENNRQITKGGFFGKLVSQYSRFIPLFALISFFSLILTSSISTKTQFDLARERVLRNPEDLDAHLILAEEFLKNNRLHEAQKELVIASILQNQKADQNSQVLGLSSTLEQLWLKWSEENPEEIRKKVDQWEKVVIETPNYRDGWLYLAVYSYQLGRKEQAKEYLQRALNLDPSFEAAREIENQFK